MENNEASASNQHQPEVATSSSLFSELIPVYLEYVRVEQGRPPITIERYRARLQRFIDELEDCPVEGISRRTSASSSTMRIVCIRSIFYPTQHEVWQDRRQDHSYARHPPGCAQAEPSGLGGTR